jgi:hypothetical protein
MCLLTYLKCETREKSSREKFLLGIADVRQKREGYRTVTRLVLDYCLAAARLPYSCNTAPCRAESDHHGTTDSL